MDSTKYLKYIGSRPKIKKYYKMKTFQIDVIIKKNQIYVILKVRKTV